MSDGADPLDTQLELLGSASQRTHGWWTHSARLALGLAPAAIPGYVALLCGAIAGPQGLALLTPSTLTSLEPVVSAALAALGVLAGLAIKQPPRSSGRVLLGATIEASVSTAAIVVALIMFAAWPAPLGVVPAIAAVLIAICGCSSGVEAAPDGSDSPPSVADQFADVDDVVPLVFGAAALGWAVTASAGSTAWLMLNAIGIAFAVAVAGWLLVSETVSEGEQRVFSVGSLLLLAGAAAYLSTSLLLVGFVAGLVWNVAGVAGRDRIARDVGHLQHPVVVMLLLIAGARAHFSTAVITLGLTFAIARIIGKAGGGWLASRAAGSTVPPDVGLRLLRPGAIGIALALNVIQALGSPLTQLVLGTVVVGAIASDVLSLLAPRVHSR